jgi:hypothetical protein
MTLNVRFNIVWAYVNPLHPCIIIHHFNVVPLHFGTTKTSGVTVTTIITLSIIFGLVGFQGTT